MNNSILLLTIGAQIFCLSAVCISYKKMVDRIVIGFPCLHIRVSRTKLLAGLLKICFIMEQKQKLLKGHAC